MKCYTFTADHVVRESVKGYVNAESEEEAIQKIKNDDYDDIIDSDIEEEIEGFQNINVYDGVETDDEEW